MAAFQKGTLYGHPCSLVQTTEPRSRLSPLYGGKCSTYQRVEENRFRKEGQLLHSHIFSATMVPEISQHILQQIWVNHNQIFIICKADSCDIYITQRGSYVQVVSNGSIYHPVLKHMFCNTISEAAGNKQLHRHTAVVPHSPLVIYHATCFATFTARKKKMAR